MRRSCSMVVLMLSAAVSACSRPDEQDKPPAAPAETASAAVGQSAPAAPANELGAEARKRPDRIDTELTAARRQRIEAAVPDARGFIVASEIEKELKADKDVDKEPLAVKAFDERALGKWVLFVAPMNAADDDGFELPVTFAHASKGDPFGMSRMWFYIRFSEVKGYSNVTAAGGQVTAVVARYNGQKRATPAHDLVGLGLW